MAHWCAALKRVRPADKAGVEAGDIIIKFDGKTVEKSSDLPRMVGGTKPGTKSTLTVFRRGSHQGFDGHHCRDRARKASRQKRQTKTQTQSRRVQHAQAWVLMVSDLTDAAKKELRIKGGVQVEAASGRSCSRRFA